LEVTLSLSLVDFPEESLEELVAVLLSDLISDFEGSPEESSESLEEVTEDLVVVVFTEEEPGTRWRSALDRVSDCSKISSVVMEMRVSAPVSTAFCQA